MESGFRLLLLEDDDTFRELLAEALELHGYQVTPVANGAAAVAAAKERPYDIIVADVRMEGMDGLAALEGVQSEHPDIGSLVITGYSTEEDSIRAIRLGVGDYLKKPFRINDFLEAVARQAEKRRQALEVARREEALRRTAAWALEALAASLPTRPKELAALEVGKLVAAAAIEFGAGASMAEQLRLASLVVAAHKAEQEVPAFLLEGLPRNVHHWVSLLEQEKAPAEAELELAWVCLGAVGERAGRPAVKEALERARSRLLEETEEQEAESPQSRTGPSLLSLARTLEQAGDLASARESFAELTRGPAPRLAMEARLGLARLALSERSPEEATTQVAQAMELARGLGPQTESQAALEGSLLLHQAGSAQAQPLAERALELARELELAPFLARATLALAQIGRPTEPARIVEAAALLAQPDHRPHLDGYIDWLLPTLLELHGEGHQASGEQSLRLLLPEFSRQLFGLISNGQVSPLGRRVAAQLLNPWGSWAEKTLEHLTLDSDPEIRKAAQASLHQGQASQPPYLRICSLGPFEVYRGDERIEKNQWKSRKVRVLLAFIASHGGRPVSEDLLIETFWPEDPERARRNLSATISQLRNNLRPDGWKEELNYLLRTRAGIQLNPELPRWHDLEELEKASAQAKRHEKAGHREQATRAYRRMAELYRGPFLDGYYEDWVLARRTNIERWLLHALVSVARYGFETGHPLEALEYAQRALELDPCCQEAYLYLVEANLALNQTAEAIRQFERCSTVLKNELGIEPSTDLLRAHQKALLAY